jgi:dihydrofolate reductase
MMNISLIAAMAENRVMGRDNQLPWRLPADLRRFKQITMGKPLLMGRKTFESIGRALPGRLNIVLSRQPGYRAEGCLVASSLETALRAAESAEEIMVIGGAQVFADTLPLARRIYLTRIHATVEGDTRFPEYDEGAWREASREEMAAEGEYPAHSFVVLERKPERRAP